MPPRTLTDRAAKTAATAPHDAVRDHFVLLVCLVFVFNLLRNLSTELPQQLADEALFLLTAKFFPNSEAVHSIGYTPYPGIVFLKIAAVFANWEQYYQWMKTWNALCFALTAAPAYLIARTLMPQSDARIGALLVGITPPSIYGAYFTAEATYILAFWIFSATAIAALRTPHRHGLAALAGAAAAITYLVKPHGVALAIAYLVSAGILVLLAQLRRKTGKRANASWNEKEPREGWTPKALLIDVAAFAVGAIAVLLLMGKGLRGEWFAALDFGVYGNLTDGTVQRAEQHPGIAAVAILVALHAAAVAAALAIPCALLALFGGQPRKMSDPLIVHCVFSLCVVAFLVLMTSKASADFHVIYGGANSLDRLNARYYSYALPLLLFAAAALFDRRKSFGPTAVALGRAAVLAGLTGCTLVVARQSFTFVDAPDLSYLLWRPATLTILAAAACIALIYMPLKQLALRRAVFVGWAAMAATSVYIAWTLQRSEDRQQVGDPAVAILRGLFEPRDLDQGIVVMNGHSVGAARVAFRLASRSKVVRTVESARAVIGPGTRWILVLGDQAGADFNMVAVQAGESTIYLTDAKKLVHLPTIRDVYSFERSSANRPRVRPAHDPESWGTWLTGNVSEIVFPESLPSHGTLTVVANVLDASRQGPVKVTICGEQHTLPLTATLARYHVPYSCKDPPTTLVIAGMMPMSPKSLGLSADARELSVALAAIAVQRPASFPEQQAAPDEKPNR